MIKKWCAIIICVVLAGCTAEKKADQPGKLHISENGKFLMDENGDPFFWLGDTGWLAAAKLTREEVEKYLEDRKQKGFNVIQISVLHNVADVNVYNDSALINKRTAQPLVTEGNDFRDSLQYDYWDHVDFIVKTAADKGQYVGMVLVWGSNVKSGKVSRSDAETYASFLANRYKDQGNLIWLNGGDVFGSDSTAIWNAIGNTLRAADKEHLITFHPRGRTQSSTWFHEEPWLDFNMFQSGHRRYDQDTAKAELRFGEDNWKYVAVDYSLNKAKPTIDGEPSYEGIPQGLHDPSEPLWEDKDVRRYGYWSVFAGAAGYTYGHNAVMQFHKTGDVPGAFGNKKNWTDALNDPGARQMIHLKDLMLSRPYFERVPDQSIVGEQGEKYDYQIATRGENYAFVYTYNGRDITINMGKINGEEVKASWYNPRNGESTEIGQFENRGTQNFDPPGDQEDGNDWVLVLDKV